jgi:large subunit ribosomal protein L31
LELVGILASPACRQAGPCLSLVKKRNSRYTTRTNMKTDIHPTYYEKAQVECACGKKFTVGSTKEKIQVEICWKCHPFYTGKQKLIDTAGKVEKFKSRREKAGAIKKKIKKDRAKTQKSLAQKIEVKPTTKKTVKKKSKPPTTKKKTATKK